jgi:tetratricopeptide (TPR) repeat protein
VAQACSVLLYDAPRSTKAAVGAVLELVREVDPRLGLTCDLLIAPFTGSGFFEWDRNSLVVALTPARSVEEAVVNAVANYRLLVDARQGSGRLADAYRADHGPDFRAQFLSDYRAWVLRAGRGRSEAISEPTFRFFAENLGPPAAGPVVPAEMVRLSVQQREAETKRLEGLVRRGQPDFPKVYRLAVLHWQAERIDEAIRMMERAAELNPDHGRTLYSLGALCRRRHLLGTARKAFRQCVQAAPNTLWSIYAHEALRRLV